MIVETRQEGHEVLLMLPCCHAPDRHGHVVAVFQLLEYEIDVFGIDVDVNAF